MKEGHTNNDQWLINNTVFKSVSEQAHLALRGHSKMTSLLKSLLLIPPLSQFVIFCLADVRELTVASGLSGETQHELVGYFPLLFPNCIVLGVGYEYLYLQILVCTVLNQTRGRLLRST